MIRKVGIKRLILVLIIVTITICIVGISNSYGATVTGTVTDIYGVNLRIAPDTSKNNIIMTVPYNSKVEILGTANGSGYNWYQIRYNGRTGYAVSDYIAKDSSGSHETGDFTNTYGTVNSDIGVNVRSGPGTGYNIIDGLFDGTEVKVNGKTTDSSGDIWYEIVCSVGKGYVFGEYLILKEVKPYEPNADFEQHLTDQGFPESYKVLLRQLHAQYPNWIFVAGKTNLDWNYVITKEYGGNGKRPNTIQNGQPDSWKSMEDGDYNFATGQYKSYDSGYYVAASRSLIEYYMDPRNFLNSTDIFQFISSKYVPSLQNSTGLQRMLNGTFMSGKFPEPTYSTYNAVLMDAANRSKVSPYTLATMIMQEQGHDGKGHSISGTEPGYYGLYNYFNIGAYASGGLSAVENGLIYARNQGWNTRAKSILGGANWFGRNYVYENMYTQYLKKFNVMNGASGVATGQYMTHVMGAYLEGANLRKAYKDFLNTSLTFEIPVYNNMPEAISPMPSRYGNNNNFLDSISVDDNSVSSFNRFTYTYTVDVGNATSINLSAKANNSAAKIEGTGQKTLKAGMNTFSITVTATSGEKRVYTVNVKSTGVTLSGIDITTKPSKIIYRYGDASIELTGAKLTATYSNGTKKSIKITNNMVSGFDLKKLGNQKVKVTYEGKVAYFDITVNPAPIDEMKAVLSYTKVEYDGKAKEPVVTIGTLKNGIDFTVLYSNNIKPGIATVTVTGKGNYTGTITLNFNINMATGLDGIFGTKDITRVYGLDRIETSIETAEKIKIHDGLFGFDSIIVANGINYADALSATSLASTIKAPILLVTNGYEQKVADYINANLTTGGKVYVIGGTTAVSDNFCHKLKTKNVIRLGGLDRYETNLSILKYLGRGGELYICTGTDYADSLSVSASGNIILLVGTSLSENQKLYLDQHHFSYNIVGGTLAVSTNIENELKAKGTVLTRIAGSDRYKTSVLVAEHTFQKTSGTVVLASGNNFPDGLVGGVLGYISSSPLILVDNNCMQDAKGYAAREGIKKCIVLGGPGIISDGTVSNIINN